MHSNGAGKALSGKVFNLFQIGALLFTIYLVPSTQAANGPGNPAEENSQLQALPTPGTYKIDPDHTFTYFSARHHLVGRVRGRFEKTEGSITVSQDPAACSVDITIDALSISTQNAQRDADLRGPAYFDVKQFPTIKYQGRGIHNVSGNSWTMDGSLTIRGVSKVVPLTFTFSGIFPNTKPGRPARAAFHASAATKRADFGMTRDNLMELGPAPGSQTDVEIEIDVEADATIAAQ
jgi:polyisoprenoid-binding protein YceI